MIQSIQFGSRKIDFCLSFSERKSLGITITPEMQVLVKAPAGTALAKVKEKVVKRAPWILKQLHYFLGFYPKPSAKKYIGGESHMLLGRQYLLKVKVGNKNSVEYKGRIIQVITIDKLKVKQLLKQWYKKHAKKKFAEVAEPLIERFKTYGVEPSGIFIQQMAKRWGSCTPEGKIILNPELIKAPKNCIEYVVIHELCHLVHHNHSQKFLDLQLKEMPDWEKWKSKLENL